MSGSHQKPIYIQELCSKQQQLRYAASLSRKFDAWAMLESIFMDMILEMSPKNSFSAHQTQFFKITYETMLLQTPYNSFICKLHPCGLATVERRKWVS
jgi:hypothetical protein